MINYKDLYDEDYYKQYDVGIAKVNYEDSQYTKAFMEGIAEKIVEQINPKTVLDVGCAMGHLVMALRNLGVEAYGIDISEYAISKVDEGISPYCECYSALEGLPKHFPQRFDLITTIEVVEHLEEFEGQIFINKLCQYGDAVLFSSTPEPDDEPTHFNVQPEEYWLRKFGEKNYFNNLEKKPVYLTCHAKVFRKKENALEAVIDYEKAISRINESKNIQVKILTETIEQQNITINNFQLDIKIELDKRENLKVENESLKVENESLKVENESLKVENGSLEVENESLKIKNEEISRLVESLKEEKNCLQSTLKVYQQHYGDAIQQRDSLQKQLEEVFLQYETLVNSTCWNITKPIRKTLDVIKMLARKNKVTNLSYRGLKCLRENGLVYTVKTVRKKLKKANVATNAEIIDPFDKNELERQKKYKFEQEIKFSILVPLYNTPEVFLKEMIESVQKQTYSNWELCLADGSDIEHAYVDRIVKQYQIKDRRIVYKKLEHNMGISNNTNACIDMSTGEYMGLFDHDDILHPSALYECMKVISEKDADFIYTDENTFKDNIANAYCPHYKSDYAPDTLRSYNYICHFSVFDKELLKQVGKFRAEFDGSQDYDLILRLTEVAETIVHIPQILYYWRAHGASVASDISAKPYTIVAAKKALKEHLERVGLEGEIEDSRVLSTYRIKYKIQGEPLISILIPNKDHKEDLQKCINSVLEKSTYKNYEIIIIENNSELPETFNYYEELCKNEQITLKTWTDKFNYSAINNFGVSSAKGQYLILLNNDVEIITPQWIEEMLMYAQREDIGIVGTMLYYPDDTVQHGGVIMGIGGIAGHAHKYFKRNDYGYMSRLTISQNLSGVTGACLMISKSLFESVGGMDENLAVAFNDVDLCVKVRQEEYLVVWTPYAELYHHESKSRGVEDTKEKQERFSKEVLYFKKKWHETLPKADPYYNPNLTLKREDYSCAVKEV